MKNPFRSSFTLPIFGIIAFLLLGTAMIIWPSALIAVIVPLLGTVLVLVGAQGVAYVIVMRGKLLDPGMKMLQGFVSLLVGVVFLLKQDVSAVFISILFGLYVLISAAISVSQAFGLLHAKKPFASDLLEGLLQLVLGLLLLFSPFSEGSLWLRVLGIHFVLAAVGMLRFIQTLKKGAHKNAPSPPPPTDKP